MKIADIIGRLSPAPPWDYGDKIPWNDPEISQRTLANHLSQNHDWGSRRQDLIDRHIRVISSHLPPKARVLDLACGPGFYTQALAHLGHSCLGVDFSPACIDYARQKASEEGLAIDYELADIRDFDSQELFDCVSFVFGEFNVFSPDQAKNLAEKAARLTKNGGLFIVEVQSFKSIKEGGQLPAHWWSSGPGEGVLSIRPHVCLQENFWDEKRSASTTRYFIIDAETQSIKMYCSSLQGYQPQEYQDLFHSCGFKEAKLLPPSQWPVGPAFEGVMQTYICYK